MLNNALVPLGVLEGGEGVGGVDGCYVLVVASLILPDTP